MKAGGRLFVHSLLAFTIAFIAATLIHEGAHAVTARALGLHAVLHHNSVATASEPEPSAAARLWVPASGPLASLLLGTVCLLGVRARRTATLTTLNFLWLGLQGSIGFFGYLVLGAFPIYGDVGRIYAELGVPGGVRWAVALAGLAALVAVVRWTTADFERQVLPADPAEPGIERPRGRLANALIAYPILAGAAITTLLSLPVPAVASLLHPLTSPFVVFTAYGRFRRNPGPLPDGARYPDRVSIPLVLVAVVLVVISRALVAGLPLG